MDLQMAQRLVDRRRAAGLSQEALAAELGVSRQAVSKWERSESSPDTDNLIALAALYGVSLDELLYGEPPTKSTESETAADSQPGEPDNASARNAEDTTGDAGSAAPEDAGGTSTEEAAPADDSASEVSDKSSDQPRVNISWRDGINVHDPAKGEEVHVGWRGVHVDNERTGEHVHIGPGGMHIDTPEDGGQSVHTAGDGSVTINGKTYDSWQDARRDLGGHGDKQRNGIARAWSKFPFPAVLLLAYLILGIIYGSWGPELFLIFTVPVYYAIGDFIERRQLSRLIATLYSVAVVAWFFIMWLYVGQPHPAWTMLLTIPVMNSFLHWCRKQWKHRKQQP